MSRPIKRRRTTECGDSDATRPAPAPSPSPDAVVVRKRKVRCVLPGCSWNDYHSNLNDHLRAAHHVGRYVHRRLSVG